MYMWQLDDRISLGAGGLHGALIRTGILARNRDTLLAGMVD